MNDREYAALLQVELVPLALRCNEVVEQADGRGEGVDGPGEMGEVGLFAPHRLDQLRLDLGQQRRISGHRLRIIEDGDVHVGGLVRQRHPAARSRQ